MFFKNRYESKELLIQRLLNSRMTLPVKEKQKYLYNEKGFEGECLFDGHLKRLSNDWVIINDLRMEHNNSEFQIDSLLISGRTIFPIEVKYLEGDYQIRDHLWYKVSGREIKNPLLQMERNATLLRTLLQDLKFNLPIEPYLVFNHPTFTLYNASLDPHIIFPTQLDRFIEKLILKSSNLGEKHYALAKKLVSMHMDESRHSKLPDYAYEQLKKGILCSSCRSLNTMLSERKIVCVECGGKENFDLAILRSVREFILLFPERKITTSNIQDWCGGVSHRAIKRVLLKYFRPIGQNRYTYYVPF